MSIKSTLKKALIFIIPAIVLSSTIVVGAAILGGFQGGTGYGTGNLGNAAVGLNLQVASTSPFLTYTFAGGAIAGSGTSTQVAYFSGASTLTSSANLTFDGTNLTNLGTTTVGTLKLSGLSANPQIYANSDPNTGINFPGPDVIQIKTGGIGRFYSDSSGHTVIGSSTTPDDTLGVVSNGTYPIFEAYTSSTNSSAFIVANSGFVGIGTTTPVTIFNVVNPSGNTGGVQTIQNLDNSSVSINHFINLTAQGPFSDYHSSNQRWAFGIASNGDWNIRNSNTSTDPVNGTTLWDMAPNGALTASGPYTNTNVIHANTLTASSTVTFSSLGTGLVKSTAGVLGNATSGIDYVSAITAGTNISISSSSGNVTVNNTAGYATSTVNGSQGTIQGGTNNFSLVSGSSTIVSTSGATTTISSRPRTAQWTANYSTSTSNWYDDFFIFDSTSTIRDILVKQQVASPDTIQFNVCYSPTSTPVNSNQNCFNVLTTSTIFTNTTSTRILPTASSTPGQMSTLRIFAQNASSTEFTMVVDYDVN